MLANNIEIKARISDLVRLEQIVAKIATQPPIDLHQIDTFFFAVNGRIKLRQFSKNQGELIFYCRSDEIGPKLSSYKRLQIDCPTELLALLSSALGVIGTVEKRRRVYIVDRTRVHLDRVESLGEFMELEVVLKDGEAVEAGVDVANSLMKTLDIRQENLVSCAYIDLLQTLD